MLDEMNVELAVGGLNGDGMEKKGLVNEKVTCLVKG